MTEKYIYTFSKAERFASKLRNRDVCIKTKVRESSDRTGHAPTSQNSITRDNGACQGAAGNMGTGKDLSVSDNGQIGMSR